MRLSYAETIAALDAMCGRFVVAWFQLVSGDREELLALGTASGRLRRADDAPTPPGAVMFTLGEAPGGGSITVDERTFIGGGRETAATTPDWFPEDALPLRDGDSIIVLYQDGGVVRVTAPVGAVADELND
jgi:hypothetical protein